LNQFLFPPAKQHQFISKLSGGERRRLQLLRTLISNPNFLVFDEPTNDLDIMTLNVLEDYLANYSGCLMIVSHDRYFMDRLVDHLFVMEGNGVISDFPGNYTDFRSSDNFKSIDGIKNESKVKDEVKQKPRTKELQNKLSYNEKREFEELTNDLPKLEQAKTKLENELNSLSDFEELNKVSLKLKELSKEIDEKEMRWLELSERNEK
jgi:ATP-binding cassette subfamily F protein uup